MKKGLYIGSFDPFTVGHLDIMLRASKLVDELYVAVSTNFSKHYFFTDAERYNMVIRAVQIQNLSNVTVSDATNVLTTDFMETRHIDVLIRGIRNSKDMEDEYTLNQYYRNLKPDLEEILLITRFPNISSTFIKECIKYKKFDIFENQNNPGNPIYVPGYVADVILKKYKEDFYGQKEK